MQKFLLIYMLFCSSCFAMNTQKDEMPYDEEDLQFKENKLEEANKFFKQISKFILFNHHKDVILKLGFSLKVYEHFAYCYRDTPYESPLEYALMKDLNVGNFYPRVIMLKNILHANPIYFSMHTVETFQLLFSFN